MYLLDLMFFNKSVDPPLHLILFVCGKIYTCHAKDRSLELLIIHQFAPPVTRHLPYQR